MCGIFGLWNTDGTAVDIDEVVRITSSLKHRGPDDEGYLLADTRAAKVVTCGGDDTQEGVHLPPVRQFANDRFDLALGFRRLSILDLSPAGHQPMLSADGRYALILNGEIYNYLELREQLGRAGRPFRSQSDSEVLLNAYATWGRDSLTRLIGMFAFAVFDRDGPSLSLARDFFGIKPLYFARREGRFAFASEIRALLRMNWVSRRVRPQQVYDYLRFGLTDDGPRTMLADIEQLPAANCLDVRPNDVMYAAPRRFWRIDTNVRADLSFEEAASKLAELFTESVWLHLRTDVPLGACLSGGIDSSSILATMRRLAPDSDLYAFCYCADDAECGEEKWADHAARQARATLFKVRLDAPNLASDLERLIETQEEPFGSTSIYAQHRVFRLAAETGVKVMLDGQGADELLAGYRPYLAARIASLAGQGRFIEAGRVLRHCSRLPGLRYSPLVRETCGLLLPPALQDAVRSVVRKPRVPRWLNRSWFERQNVHFDLLWTSRQREVLREKLLDTLTRTSLPMLLRYEDRNSMAYSLESRVPFLTPALVQFVFSLPEQYLVARDGTSKAVFRAAMRKTVPDDILDRRDKIGFATPERRWLTELQPWVERVLSSQTAHRLPVLRQNVVQRQWNRLQTGMARFDFRFWRWINLIAWAERFDVQFES